MIPSLRAVADRQCGLFTRADAVAAGYTERQLKTLTGHRGRWLVIRRGVYAERELVASLDEDGRYLLGCLAAALASHGAAVLSHTSAAAVHVMPIRPRWRSVVHLTRPDVTGGRGEGGVKHHRALLPEKDLVVVNGIAVTSLARTAVDVAREHGFEDGVVAADAALRLGATRGELDACVEECRSWPHNTSARAAVEIADGGAESIGETLLRLLLHELDIGKPQTQYVVTDGRRTAYVDLRVGRHLFEFDGRVKYVERDLGGVADRPPNQVVWDEKRREDWLRRTGGGYGVSRVVWEELFGPQRRRTKERLLAEYLETLRRFGEGGAA